MADRSASSRGRAWRRDQTARKLAHVLGFVQRNNQHLRIMLLHGGRYPDFAFTRRVSSFDSEVVRVTSPESFDRFEVLVARKLRDNAAPCGCNVCRNPRRSIYSKGRERLTVQERQSEQSRGDNK